MRQDLPTYSLHRSGSNQSLIMHLPHDYQLLSFTSISFFFPGCHISEVLQENEALQRRVEQLQSDTEQEKKDLKAQVSQAKDERDRC